MSSPVLPKPRAVIFDWDNTLVDTWPIIHEALHHTFVAMQVEPWPLEVTMKRVRKSMRDSFPEIFGENWHAAAEIYQQQYRANQLKLTALPGAEELIRAVHDAGLYSVVVSNKKGPNLRREIEHLGWGPWFHKVVGADDAARDKPFADPVHMALEGSNITPAPDVWFIGDSEVDLECAKNTGCTPILYGPIVAQHAEFDAKGTYQGHAFAQYFPDHTELTKRFRPHAA
uniref:Putative phosphatase n=1 Tax=uncultured bacterium CSL1 TaxID=1091565 RepID=G4WVA1_9BACT|nr:putative phosphatase [uncultured bacterium CSL1]